MSHMFFCKEMMQYIILWGKKKIGHTNGNINMRLYIKIFTYNKKTFFVK